MAEPLRFTSDADWLRELSRLEHPFGASRPREIREKAERFDEIAMKLDALYAIQKDYKMIEGKLDERMKLLSASEAHVARLAFRITELESRLDTALGLLRDVATSGVEFEDERVSYVTVQIDSDTLAKIRAVERPAHITDDVRKYGREAPPPFELPNVYSKESPAKICGATFPPGQFAVQMCSLPEGHAGEHANNVRGL